MCINKFTNLFLISFFIVFFSCEDDSGTVSADSNTEPELQNTLDDILSGQQGEVVDYFYNLSGVVAYLWVFLHVPLFQLLIENS